MWFPRYPGTCVQDLRNTRNASKLTLRKRKTGGEEKDWRRPSTLGEGRQFHTGETQEVPQVSTKTVANISVLIESEKRNVDPIHKKTKVLIVPQEVLHAVQTDKKFYKPGQKVGIRLVSLDTNFIPVPQMYPIVEIQDPLSNRIGQWLNMSNDRGILDLYFSTNRDSEKGTYHIIATSEKKEEIRYSFKIEEYVLPKYDVQLQLPSVITVFDEKATIKICGKYTYGKPVHGIVTVVICRKGYRYYYWYRRNRGGQMDPCKTFTVKTEQSGCGTVIVNVKEFFTTDYVVTGFGVTADLKEKNTGVKLTESGDIRVPRQVRRVTIEDTAATYKHGLPYEGKVKVTGADGKPVPNAVVILSTVHKTLRLKTEKNGKASFSLETTLWKGNIILRAQPESTRLFLDVPSPSRPIYLTRQFTVLELYSPSKSFVQIQLIDGSIPCGQDVSLSAQYIIQGKELKNYQDTLTFYYMVMARGEIRQQSSDYVSLQYGVVNKGKFSMKLSETTNLAPYAQVIVYTMLPSGEVVADSRNFPVQLCFNNKVSLQFSHLQHYPGENTTLSVRAEPGSLCSIRAIDLSVLLLQQGPELTAADMYDQLPWKKLMGYDYRAEDLEFSSCQPMGSKSTSVIRPWPQKNDDIYSIFKKIGIKLSTNMDVRKPLPCTTPPPTTTTRMTSLPATPNFGTNNDFFTTFFTTTSFPILATTSFVTMPSTFPTTTSFPSTSMNMPTTVPQVLPQKGEDKKKKIIRKIFPDTWIWMLTVVGDDGTVSMEKTVPDTITKWVAGAFCVSQAVGFGVSPNIGLTTFKPFFVSLTLPYSVIRGESFTLKATVFNYESKCIRMKITLADSNQFTYKKCFGCQYSVCLCGEESMSFSWIVTPTALDKVKVKVSAEALTSGKLCANKPTTVPDKGRIDTVIRELLVEAEGTPQMVSLNNLLCPTTPGRPVQETMSLVLPKEFVEGSVKASVTVVGDLMGSALNNIEKLLRMPSGCGEQNMLRFVPNIFILDYLDSTHQLTEETLKKGKQFLESGYQRELRYKHPDGSYSAFGSRDKSGNTWLTTFVLKSFEKVKKYISINEVYITQAKGWLSNLQRPDGCFRSVGKLFHNRMKGGVSDDVTLTAYIVAAMLEIDNNNKDATVQNGLRCLKNALKGPINNLYTTALMSYTFTLANDPKMRKKLMKELDKKSKTEDGKRYLPGLGARDSLEVEMTSYFLLAVLSGPTLKSFDMRYAASVVSWLVKQQNPFGGFSSTQDTVVALQALAVYASAIYTKNINVKMTVKGNKETIHFSVDESNRLLYQQETLSEGPGKYTVTAEGNGCVLVQISMFYNIPPPPDSSAFGLFVDTLGDCNLDPPKFHLTLEVRFQGQRKETNMVIVNIKILSGYILDEDTVPSLEGNMVRRVEVEGEYINIYLEELLNKKSQPIILTFIEDQHVNDLKPAVIKVYDYYLPTDEAFTYYTSPCKDGGQGLSPRPPRTTTPPPPPITWPPFSPPPPRTTTPPPPPPRTTTPPPPPPHSSTSTSTYNYSSSSSYNYSPTSTYNYSSSSTSTYNYSPTSTYNYSSSSTSTYNYSPTSTYNYYSSSTSTYNYSSTSTSTYNYSSSSTYNYPPTSTYNYSSSSTSTYNYSSSTSTYNYSPTSTSTYNYSPTSTYNYTSSSTSTYNYSSSSASTSTYNYSSTSTSSTLKLSSTPS
ncbi:alpha-2-macroglobulin-like protein 1 [Cheilinus undulatus]|uniref:alpha-2-macroglobulin-like protein 1 n=1 Tax=Cheilinus undulatus TaxID=241271 RepID=UPI001BD64FB8|nr:alpha-2-macroglobulin-like protein 1 [Cheilinus undulatus]